jgi:CDP-4-dehydro-6-deoxyglucose reductase, E3
MHKVTLTNGKSFDCSEDNSIIDGAKLANIYLEHSCLTGRCGRCAAIVDGATILLQEEVYNEIDLDSGFVLTCCRAPREEINLEMDDLAELADYPPLTLPCRVDSVNNLSSDVVEVTLRTPPSSLLSYLPGQYIDIIWNNGIKRSYSVANAPRGDGKLVLHIKRIEGGVLSNYWFGSIRKDDLLRLRGPLGTFFLRDAEFSTLVLMATGTGIAPIKAILEQLNGHERKKFQFDRILLYWGARNRQDLYLTPNFTNINMEYRPVLSRPDSDWRGRTGYVQENVLADEVDLSKSVVYACGSEKMINASWQEFFNNGLLKKYFYSDAFLPSN